MWTSPTSLIAFVTNWGYPSQPTSVAWTFTLLGQFVWYNFMFQNNFLTVYFWQGVGVSSSKLHSQPQMRCRLLQQLMDAGFRGSVYIFIHFLISIAWLNGTMWHLFCSNIVQVSRLRCVYRFPWNTCISKEYSFYVKIWIHTSVVFTSNSWITTSDKIWLLNNFFFYWKTTDKRIKIFLMETVKIQAILSWNLVLMKLHE